MLFYPTLSDWPRGHLLDHDVPAAGSPARYYPWVLIAGLFGLLGGGCLRPAIPDPKPALRVYAHALARGDSEAIYRLMTTESQRAFGRRGTRERLGLAKEELSRESRALLAEPPRVRTAATVRFVDGEQAVLVWERGRLTIETADALPYAARSPEQALATLRAALARRSYPALVRVLTLSSRGAMESDLRSLVEGLRDPSALDVRIRDDEAEVDVPGGHTVKLKREAGVWRIRDFD
jgi:hypothetical protein